MKDKTVSTDSVVSRIQEVIAGDIDGEIVMMSIENGKYYGLDEIGSLIWTLMEAPIKVSALIDTLLERFEVDRETCEKDVLRFLNHLNEGRILMVNE